MTYHPETKKITVESRYSGWWEWTVTNATVNTFVDAYMPLAESVVFSGTFGKIHTRDRNNTSNMAFFGSQNLVSICFPENARIVDYAYMGYGFAECPKLTTIYFGDEADMKMGVADFSGMYSDKEDSPTKFAKALFRVVHRLQRSSYPISTME
jgi:hypothetical protein